MLNNKEFIRKVREDVINLKDANIDEYALSDEEVIYYVGEKIYNYNNYQIGDIVFVSKFKYKNGFEGTNHLFVIIGDDNYAIPIKYFCMLISSNLKKLKYKGNILLERNAINKLNKNSIVKIDQIYNIDKKDIDYCIGKVPFELIKIYNEMYLKNKEEYNE